MRMLFAVGVALLIPPFAATPLLAQSKGPVQITSVRVGFLPGPMRDKEDPFRRGPMYRVGQWTPAYVTVEGKQSIKDAVLIVQSTDSDDVQNEYAVKIPLIEFTAETPSHTFVSYTRPGKPEETVSVRLQANGRDLCPSSEVNPFGLQPSYYLYLTLGARLPGVYLPGSRDQKDESRRSEIAAIDRVEELPDKWYGYGSADVVVLTTGDIGFADGLFSDEAKRGALFEWVRRGGKLLLSVGKNYGQLANRELLKVLLPVELAGTSTPKSIRVDFQTLNADDLADPFGKNLLDLTKLEIKPGRGARELATYVDAGKRGPLVVQAPYGLGRVTVVGIDLDQPPFTRWKGQAQFWEMILNQSGPSYSSTQLDEGSILSSPQQHEQDMVDKVKGSLESFDGVPVISFGWVALFILVYIIVVGPLDYYFLKKVVKRLELTWITFPLVVLGVSAGAYFCAYALKGDDQKINKLDLIDIDYQTDTIQGTSMFSIFSPRIQNYTVGIEPADGWGGKKELVPRNTPLVSWLGKPQGGRKSLFRRSYEYDTATGGLHRVPIQVWSTKSFQATWQARIDPVRPPIKAELFNNPDDRSGSPLSGSITSYLPANLEDVVLLHRGKVYSLQTLISGDANRKRWSASTDNALSWAKTGGGFSPVSRGGYAAPSAEPSRGFMRELMFHEAYKSGEQKRAYSNGSLREYDQSWRINVSEDKDSGDFAVLVGKLAVASGKAEDVANQPATATRLWLGALPDGSAPRPPLQGFLRQETYVRIYLPVKTRK